MEMTENIYEEAKQNEAKCIFVVSNATKENKSEARNLLNGKQFYLISLIFHTNLPVHNFYIITFLSSQDVTSVLWHVWGYCVFCWWPPL